ncbi:MAG: hypothetical protein ACI88A_003670 [Paraglaciecola sp.]|jgi:hypothetical protein
MESYHTKMRDLFAQLGLPSEQISIENFIQTHKGLAQRTHIEDAEFWTTHQAEFIKNALVEDAEWAELIDQLNALLR